MPIKVREVSAGDVPAWDMFVLQHPAGSPFHLNAWKNCIETTFHYEPRYFVAEREGVIAGVLPLFLVQNAVIGKVLISTPFAVYGGILADGPEALEEIAGAAKDLAQSLQVEHLELRNGYPEQCAGFAPVDRYVTFTQPVGPDLTPESLLETVHKKTRNMIRKSLKTPFTTRPAANLDAFERLMANNYRRLGTPCFPRRHFERILEQFGPMVDVREIMLDNRVVAATMNFLFRDQMHTYYAASDPAYLAMAPNNYLYFDHLLWAGQHGYQTFDFGRSKRDTGTFEFKRHWGTTMRELPYEVLLVKRKEMPNFTPKNPKFEMAIKVWQRLPLPLTKMLGPRLVRLFP